MPAEDQRDATPHGAVTTQATLPEETVPSGAPSFDDGSDVSVAGASVAGGETPNMAPQILQEVRSLHRDFQTKLLYDDAKQKQLDTMHSELQEHRRGMHFQLLRPVFTDLIALLDGMISVSARLRREQGDESGATAQATILDQFREQIEETLRRNGVEPYTTSDTTFDRERQRAIGVVDTSDPALDNQIAAHVRPGYLYEGRIVVQTEQVKTYRYTPPTSVSSPPFQS